MIPAHHAFVKTVGAALRRQCRVPAGAHLLVATSGGADSVALLRALAAIAPRRHWKIELTVGHVQHHLRDEGGEAEKDADFTRRLAGQLELPFERFDLDLDAYPGSRNLEARAREARYVALTELAEQVGALYVVTAHHGDDQLETLLMRLLRGSSVRGLRGMQWHRRIWDDTDIRLIRPMLDLDRPGVRNFLHDVNQTWCEDHTNADVTRLRARLRKTVVPPLRDIRSDVAQRARNLSRHMRDVSRLLDDTVEELARQYVYQDSAGNMVLHRHHARRMLEVVLTELVRQQLLAAGAKRDTLGRRALQPILNAIQDSKGGQRRFELSGNVRVTVTRETVEIHVPGREVASDQ